jgi:CCR4-NOT transcription complex subunit 1
MYHHFLRRAAQVANPIIHNLIGHSQKYKDDPAAPPPTIPSTGPAAFVWRLLLTEAVRASRDVSLAPHFCTVMLSPAQQTSLPVPSLRIFGLPNSFLFSLTAYTLASPNVYLPNHASAEMVHMILRQTFPPVMEQLRAPNIPFWAMGPTSGTSSYTDDLSLQEARTLILALYPRSSPSSGNNNSRPTTPTNPTAPHPSPLTTHQRATLLGSLAIRFSSPAIILQSLSALSPGGPPRTPGSIPLEDVLFELGEGLTQDEGTVEAVIGRWWGPYLLEGLSEPEQSKAITEEASRTIHGLCEGLREGRAVDVHGVVKGLSSIVSSYEAVLTSAININSRSSEIVRHSHRYLSVPTLHVTSCCSTSSTLPISRSSHHRPTPRLSIRTDMEQHDYSSSHNMANDVHLPRRHSAIYDAWRTLTRGVCQNRRSTITRPSME